ncbi:hypothetical protein LWI29_004861 [Acer saccharum]|uniref:Uncharacterized protein n=1 Tax=Acer saccharum TaxID=4024 RepID=A0AA39RG19_ACESA|nr:hypothetical protein LWI29_004861 [Acer saccharum]
MSRSGEIVHVLVFLYPAQGHTLPLLDLTHQLSLCNITITVLTTPKNKPLLNANPTIQTLVFPFPSHPLIPPGVENVREFGNRGNLPVMLTLTNLFDPIVDWFQSHHNLHVAIISDFFLGWTLSLTNQIHIPRINFCSFGAFLCSVLDYVEDLGVAIRVCKGADSVSDSDELGKVIAESLNEWVETKVKAKELIDKALAGVRSRGGSSIADLDRLVQDLNNLQLKTLLPGGTEKE